MRHIWDAKVSMRDGVNLSADVYLPDFEGEYPIIVIGTPYDNTMKSHVDMAAYFVSHGYGFVVYDVRGRYDSEGDFYPFFNEGPDGYDLIEWTAAQSWSNGKTGMMGGSYRGWIQWATAKEKPPHLTTMIPTATGGKWMQELPFFNGIPCLLMFGWMNFVGARTNQNTTSPTVDWERVYNTLPLNQLDKALGRSLPIWNEWLSHPDMDEFWKKISFTKKDFENITIPALHITGYYDGDQPGALHYYDNTVKYSEARDNQYILIGPWDHAGTRFPRRVLGGVDFTNASLMEMREVHLEWFDYWLKGVDNGVKDWAKTRYYLIGENTWKESDKHWSPAEKTREYYLSSGGNANTLKGDGELQKEVQPDGYDAYSYNPENPLIPSLNYDFYGTAAETPLDSRHLLRRDDNLVYTSKPLQKPFTVTGRPIVELYAGSDCPDTDFFVHLFDVYPDGRSILMSSGLIRARYRNGLERQEFMEPDKVYRFNIEMSAIGNKFKKGHRLRFAVTSSEFPQYARNTNTGNPVITDTDIRTALNKVYHGEKYPSQLILPI